MNPLLKRLAPAPADRVRSGYGGSRELLDLTVGTPWYGPPESFRSAMADLVAAGDGGLRDHDAYAPPHGSPRLRSAIVGHYRTAYGMDLDENRVLVTHGATGAVCTALLTVSGVGDEVLLPDPCYTLYEPMVTLLGRRARRVPGDPHDGYRLDPDRVARAVTARTAVLLLNSPVNPTGAMYDGPRLAGIAEVLAAAGVHLVHDEVLDCFAWRERHVPAATAAHGVIMVNSLSKRLGVTGWRVGWLAGDRKIVDAAARVHALTTIAVNHAAQLAGAAALSAPDNDRVVAGRAAGIAATGRTFLRALAQVPGMPPDLDLPAGGVYAFVPIDGLARHLGIDHETGAAVDIEVADALRDRCGVAVLPGSAFGAAGRDHVRISLAAPELRLLRAAARIQELR